jgi:NTP pyrophosphatase (non-canonical NTP hydrolase)
MSDPPLNFTLLQLQVRKWADSNFPAMEPWEPLVGAMEELGELAHAHLKKKQGIRTREDHDASKKDAVGDIVVYLANYCGLNGIDFQEAVELAWKTASSRSRIGYPDTADQAALRSR